MLSQKRNLIGRGPKMERRMSKETQECSATRLTISRFTVMGLVSCLWLVILTYGPSWWSTPCSTKMDTSKEDPGRLERHVALLLTYPKILPTWWWFVSFMFLTRMSCHNITCTGYSIRSSITWLLWCLGRMGGFRQVSPNNWAWYAAFVAFQKNEASLETQQMLTVLPTKCCSIFILLDCSKIDKK